MENEILKLKTCKFDYKLDMFAARRVELILTYLAESESIYSYLHSPHSESYSSPLSRQAQNTHSKSK